MPNKIKQIVAEVLCASNPVRCLEQYLNCSSAKEITFLLFDGIVSKTTDSNTVNKFRENKYNLVNLGLYDRMAVINTSILKRKDIVLKIEYTVNFDSNIISYLSQIIRNEKIDGELLNFLKYIKTNGLNMNMLPYSLEDSLNSTGMRNEARTYESILGYFAFDRMTLQDLNNLPFAPDVDDFCHADNVWQQMKNSRYYERDNEKRARSIYCFLLMVYIIQFQSRKSSNNKMIELIDFVNNELGVYFEHGMLLAYWYFNQSYKCIKLFFGKIQPNAKDKLKKIEGMAWDLFHLWNMPTVMAIMSKQHKAIVLPSLATRDESFASIVELNPIKRIAFYNGEAQVQYMYSLNDVLDYNMLKPLEDMREQRELLCTMVDLHQLSVSLEKRLLDIFNSNNA